jgi:hypothetical protein
VFDIQQASGNAFVTATVSTAMSGISQNLSYELVRDLRSAQVTGPRPSEPRTDEVDFHGTTLVRSLPAKEQRCTGQLQRPELRSGTKNMLLFLVALPPKTTTSFLQSGTAASIAAANGDVAVALAYAAGLVQRPGLISLGAALPRPMPPQRATLQQS